MKEMIGTQVNADFQDAIQSNPPDSPFSKRGKRSNNDSSKFLELSLLPLEKGGREGFLRRPFQNTKLLRFL
jgi:hypothetical protein